MKIIDEALLQSCRGPGPCEVCGKMCRVREPLHIFSRGAGRVDITENILAVGSTLGWQCQCHTKAHAGKISRAELLEISARRHGTTAAEIEAEVYRLRRIPK